MINFRYHLVSLTAVLVALAVGILVGASLADDGRLSRLQGAVNAVRGELNERDATISRQGRDLRDWDSFTSRTGDALLSQRLRGVPVVVVAVRGVENQPVKDLRDALVAADAELQGTVWLTGKWRLAKPDDVRSLASATELPELDADSLRAAAIDRLARALVADPALATSTAATATTSTVPDGGAPTRPPDRGPESRRVVAALAESGFLDFDPAPAQSFDAASVRPTTRFVVASGQHADVPDPVAAVPLVRAMAAASSTSRVVAVESGRPANGKEPEVRSVFVSQLRAIPEVDARVSTVNNIEQWRGRAATVLAVAELAAGRVGHYGVGPGADGPGPE